MREQRNWGDSPRHGCTRTAYSPLDGTHLRMAGVPLDEGLTLDKGLTLDGGLTFGLWAGGSDPQTPGGTHSRGGYIYAH